MTGQPGSYMPRPNVPQPMDPTLTELLMRLGLRPQPVGLGSANPPTGGLATGPAIAGTMDTGAFSPYQPPQIPMQNQSNAASGRAPTDTRESAPKAPPARDDRFAGASGSSVPPPNVGQRTQMGSTQPPGLDPGQWPQVAARQAGQNLDALSGGFLGRVFNGPEGGMGGLWDKIQLLFSAGGEGWQDVARRLDEAGVQLPQEIAQIPANMKAAGGIPVSPAAPQGSQGPVASPSPAPAPQAAPAAPAPAAPQAGGGMGGLIDMLMGKGQGLYQAMQGAGGIPQSLAAPQQRGPISAGGPPTVQHPPNPTVGTPTAPVSVATAPATSTAAVNQIAANPGTPGLPPKPAIPIPQAAPPPLANEPLTASEAANLAAVGGPGTASNAAASALKAASGVTQGAGNKATEAPSGGRITAPQQVDVQSILNQLLGIDPGVPRAPNPLIGADLR